LTVIPAPSKLGLQTLERAIKGVADVRLAKIEKMVAKVKVLENMIKDEVKIERIRKRGAFDEGLTARGHGFYRH
jgi:predicted alpha/beta-fold hydrolase